MQSIYREVYIITFQHAVQKSTCVQSIYREVYIITFQHAVQKNIMKCNYVSITSKYVNQTIEVCLINKLKYAQGKQKLLYSLLLKAATILITKIQLITSTLQNKIEFVVRAPLWLFKC